MITKTQATAAMTAKDEADQKALETRIDESLVKFHGSPINVSAEGVSSKVIERVTALYVTGGWTVTPHSGDQRDPGPWLTFS